MMTKPGGAFLLVYLAMVLLVGVPLLLLGESALSRAVIAGWVQ